MPGRHARPRALTAVALLLFTLTACSQSPSDPVGELLKPLAGNWKVVSLDRDGKKSTADTLKRTLVSVEGDTFRLTETIGADRTEGEVTSQDAQHEEYVIQPNPASRGEVDFVPVIGLDHGKTRPGLYALEGETLKICIASVGGTRPAQISPGRGLTVFVLQRRP